MGRSVTWMMKAPTVASYPGLSSILVRMMISINDISLAADAGDRWAEETNSKRKTRQIPARQYFVRILLSHVHEALGLISEIEGDSKLRAAVDRCDAQTVSEYEKLVAITKAEKEHLRKFRSRATFHYDKQLSEKLLKMLAEVSPDRPWSATMGTEPIDWHFGLGDEIIGGIVIREAMGLNMPHSKTRSEKTAEIAGRLQDISRLYTSFAGHFIRSHCK